MTAAQRIKDSLIDYLSDNSPDESIAVVDARQRGVIELPTLTVDVTGTAIHSTTLANVTQAQAQIVLRCHTGDEDDADIAAWIDALESMFFDKSLMIATCGTPTGVIFYDWNYNGSTQDFDDAILEVAFTAEILFMREP
jgi:hypothetical protein